MRPVAVEPDYRKDGFRRGRHDGEVRCYFAAIIIVRCGYRSLDRVLSGVRGNVSRKVLASLDRISIRHSAVSGVALNAGSVGGFAIRPALNADSRRNVRLDDGQRSGSDSRLVGIGFRRVDRYRKRPGLCHGQFSVRESALSGSILHDIACRARFRRNVKQPQRGNVNRFFGIGRFLICGSNRDRADVQRDDFLSVGVGNRFRRQSRAFSLNGEGFHKRHCPAVRRSGNAVVVFVRPVQGNLAVRALHSAANSRAAVVANRHDSAALAASRRHNSALDGNLAARAAVAAADSRAAAVTNRRLGSAVDGNLASRAAVAAADS